ncbi:RNA polymerase sigma factor [Aquimarina megaterium]|uniref:RNA polymerase sigma factor n=1 Tax=Aquimarina megaterium TaxID=1443666 RepID=UPI0004722827|nr:sigma-70 family RNA polymerase sigma factor [Aquimarina megaterium]
MNSLKMISHKDHKIIKGIITGDSFIIDTFYQENFQYVGNYILENSGNEEDIKDIFQDAMIIIYNKLIFNQLNIKGSLRSYFYGICKNLWRNQYRKESNIIYSNSLLKHLQKQHIYTSQNMEIKERQDIYQRYYMKLSREQQKLLNLSFEGKSSKEISKIMKYTEGYVRKKKHYSKNRLQKMIEKDPSYKELVNC